MLIQVHRRIEPGPITQRQSYSTRRSYRCQSQLARATSGIDGPADLAFEILQLVLNLTPLIGILRRIFHLGDDGPFLRQLCVELQDSAPDRPAARLPSKWPQPDTRARTACSQYTRRDRSRGNSALHGKQSTGQTSTQSVNLHLIQASVTTNVMLGTSFPERVSYAKLGR